MRTRISKNDLIDVIEEVLSESGDKICQFDVCLKLLALMEERVLSSTTKVNIDLICKHLLEKNKKGAILELQKSKRLRNESVPDSVLLEEVPKHTKSKSLQEIADILGMKKCTLFNRIRKIRRNLKKDGKLEQAKNFYLKKSMRCC